MGVKIALVGESEAVWKAHKMIKCFDFKGLPSQVKMYNSSDEVLAEGLKENIIAIDEKRFLEDLPRVQLELIKRVNKEDDRIILTQVTDDFNHEKIKNWLKELEVEETYIKIPIKGGVREERVEEIVYFENIKRHIYVQTKNNRYKTALCLSGAKELTETFSFVSPYISFIVNLAMVEEVKSKKIIMKNGELLPLSQKKAHLFRKTYKEFLSTL